MRVRPFRTWSPLALVVALALGAPLAGCADDGGPRADSPPPVPDGVVYHPQTVSPFAAPRVEGELLADNTEADNTALFADRVTVISFVASWCGICSDTQSTLKRLREEYGDAVALLSVAGDGEDTRADLETFVRSSGTDWPVVFDPEARTWRNFAVSEAPAIGVVDSAGSIVRLWPGGADAATVSETLADLIELPE